MTTHRRTTQSWSSESSATLAEVIDYSEDETPTVYVHPEAPSYKVHNGGRVLHRGRHRCPQP